MLKRCLLTLSLLAGAALLSGCPGSSDECDGNFDVRCENGEAVNCSTTHCGFGPCDYEVTKNSCSSSCKMVQEEEAEENYELPHLGVRTDQAAVCTEWKTSSPDAGTSDAGSSDAGMSDAGGDDVESSDSGTDDVATSDGGDVQGN